MIIQPSLIIFIQPSLIEITPDYFTNDYFDYFEKYLENMN